MAGAVTMNSGITKIAGTMSATAATASTTCTSTHAAINAGACCNDTRKASPAVGTVSAYHPRSSAATPPVTSDSAMPDRASRTIAAASTCTLEEFDDDVAAESAPAKPRSANESRCTHAETSSSGTNTTAATVMTALGAAFTTAMPPSSTSAAVMGRIDTGIGTTMGASRCSWLSGVESATRSLGRASGATHGCVTTRG